MKSAINEAKYNYSIIIAATILIIITIISAFLRIIYGWDQDESYVIYLATKIAEGEKLFEDLWDLHQTSAIIPAIFVKAYVSLLNSYDGIGKYLRIISIIIQWIVAFFSFYVMKKHYGKRVAFLSAIIVANMLPRATQQLEYGTLTVWGAVLCSVILLDLYFNNRYSLIKLIVAAFFYSISVLSYPTMVVTLVIIVYYFIKSFIDGNKESLKHLAIFGGVCALLACLFIIYVFHGMSISHVGDLLNAIGNSGDHENRLSAFLNLKFWLKPFVRILGSVIISVIITLLINKIYKIKIESFYIYLLLVTIMVFSLNLTGIRPSGPFGFLERYIGAVILFLFLPDKLKDKPIFILFYLMGIGIFIGSILGSNLGLNENAMFLELSLIACVMSENNFTNTDCRFVKILSVVVFIFGIAFFSGYFVRVNGTEPANFAQCSYTLKKGALRGIKVNDNQKTELVRKMEAVKAESQNGMTYAVLSNDPIYNYSLAGKTSAPRYVTTVAYNSQWIDYYEKFGHAIPDVLFIDTIQNPDLMIFYETEFGSWVRKHYYIENTEYNDVFLKLVLNNN